MSSAHAALIVDADPKGLESLVYGFQGADWRITACPTPETASLLVKASGAALVVIASRTDHDKAHALIRQIRGKESLRTLPILLLGPQELRAELKDRPDVDLLSLPAYVYDVLTASHLLVGAGAMAAQRPGDELRFATAIADNTTVSLVRTMIGLGRSGQLQLKRKGRQGEILFHQGEVTGAQVGPLQGMAAIQHLLVWNDGESELHLRPVAKRGQLHQTAQEFLEEFERFQRDFSHAIKDIGPLAAIYLRDEEQLRLSAGAVPAEVTPVVRLCDGEHALADVIDQSPFRVLDTVRIMSRLVEVGIAKRADAQAVVAPARPRSPIEEFWETARILAAPRPRQGTTPPPSTPGSSGEAAAVNILGSGEPRPQRRTLEIGATPPPIVPAPQTEVSVAPGHETSSPRPVVQQPIGNPPTQPGGIVVPTAPMPLSVPSVTAGTGPDPMHGAPSSGHASGTVIPLAPMLTAMASPTPGVTPAPTSGTAPGPVIVGSLGTHTSGAIDVPMGARRGQDAQRGVGVPTIVVEAAIPQPAHPAPQPAQVALQPAPVAPVSSASSGPEAGSSAPAMPISGPPQASPPLRVTGEMQIAPSRKTQRQAPVRVSIQLDDSLSNAHNAHAAARVPPAATSTPPAKSEQDELRVTGEMLVAPSGKGARGPIKSERVSTSFHIDPSLTEAAPPAPTPARAEPAPASVTSDKDAPPHAGGFSDIESDFFDRESELYKVEKAESFADLDDGAKSRGIGKNAGDRTGKRR